MSAEQIPGVTSVTGSTEATDHGDYWEVDVYSDSIIFVGSNTFENVLINTNGNIAQVNATGHGWTVRNVGWNGLFPNKDLGTNVALAISGSGTAEHLYLGDGGLGDWKTKHQQGQMSQQPVGVFSTNDNPGGNITIRDVYLENWTDNAMYLEGQGTTANYTIERVYGTDNDISMIRPGKGNHVIRDCHGEGNTNRDLWNRVGSTVQVENCQFDTGIFGPANTDAATTTGAAANPQPPASVPTTAQEAVTGSGSGPGTPVTGREHVYEIINHRENRPVEYYLSAEPGANITHTNYNDAVIDSENQWVSDDGNRAAGRITGAFNHALEFDTLLTDVDIRVVDGVSAYVDGQPSDYDSDYYPRAGGADDSWQEPIDFPLTDDPSPPPGDGGGDDGGGGDGGGGDDDRDTRRAGLALLALGLGGAAYREYQQSD